MKQKKKIRKKMRKGKDEKLRRLSKQEKEILKIKHIKSGKGEAQAKQQTQTQPKRIMLNNAFFKYGLIL